MPSDPHTVIHDLIVAGEALRDTNDQEPSADAFAVWIDQAREVLLKTFGHGHRFVVGVEEAADGATRRDAEDLPPRHLRMLTLVGLQMLRRAAVDLQFHAKVAARAAMPAR
jgi:hypothetical protein